MLGNIFIIFGIYERHECKMIKKRNIYLAAILSLLQPGIGHVYVGRAKQGFILIAAAYSIMLLLGLSGILSTFYGILLLAIFGVTFYISVIAHSVRLAKNSKEYNLKPYNKWYWYILLVIIFSILSELFFSQRIGLLGYETYKIPARAMTPTLQAGDFITVDTRYSQYAIGDIVVFQSDKADSKPLVKRIAAVGGDSIRISKGNIIRNGKVADIFNVPESKRKDDYSTSMERQIVPENEVFLIGDWRDNSKDSRLFGTIMITDIIGKVTYIYWSSDMSRIGIEVK